MPHLVQDESFKSNADCLVRRVVFSIDHLNEVDKALLMGTLGSYPINICVRSCACEELCGLTGRQLGS